VLDANTLRAKNATMPPNQAAEGEMMRLIADENLAYVDYFFSEHAQIDKCAGRGLRQADLRHCQALLVRSVTQVNAALLENTAVRFVGSATIGTDHLDQAYLHAQQIAWANAAGCNAQAVAEYVVTALLKLQPALLNAGAEFCLGIVGLGNVGTRLAALAHMLGWSVIGTDPERQHPQLRQLELKQLLQQADAVSIHVPLTTTGPHATRHLFDRQRLALMPAKSILINSSRGEVILEADLIANIEQTQRQVVLDVFPQEPQISEHLLDVLALATPHIAGYTLEGKARGTQMIYQAFCQHFHYDAHKDFNSQLSACPTWFKGQDLQQVLLQRVEQLYDIGRDDAALRACLQQGRVAAIAFDQLRKEYPLRREWSAYGA
jgi:erythronate-4-phosphate dehydrogenase